MQRCPAKSSHGTTSATTWRHDRFEKASLELKTTSWNDDRVQEEFTAWPSEDA